MNAFETYAQTLRRYDTWIETDDFGGFADSVVPGVSFGALDATCVYNRYEDAALGMKRFTTEARALGVRDAIRRCTAARMIDDETLVGYHHTLLQFADGREDFGYLTRMSLRKRDGEWKIARAEGAIGHAEFPAVAPDTKGGQRTLRPELSPQTNRGLVALAQMLINRMDFVLLTSDYDAWRNCMSIPVTLVDASGNEEVLETEEQLRQSCERYRRSCRIHGVTEAIRHVQSAEFTPSGQLRVSYRGHLLRGSTHVVPPWDAVALLDPDGGLWRLSHLEGSIGTTNWRPFATAPEQTDRKDQQ